LVLLEKSALTDAIRINIQNGIAYTDALLGTPELLEEADRYSAEALAAYPWDAGIQNTRGVALLALGRVDDALPLLRASATQPRPNLHDTAQCQCTLAMAEARDGQITAAERALESARLAEPDCFLIPRAEAALQAARDRKGVRPHPTNNQIGGGDAE
jgi:predicted Zn-dependent protease